MISFNVFHAVLMSGVVPISPHNLHVWDFPILDDCWVFWLTNIKIKSHYHTVYLSSDKVVKVPVYLICIYNVVMFIQNRYSIVLFLVLNVMASLPVKKCPNCGQDMTLKSKKDRKG